MKTFFDVLLPRRCVSCKTLISSTCFCFLCGQKIRTARNSSSHAADGLFLYNSVIRELLLRAKFSREHLVAKALASYLRSTLDSLEELPEALTKDYDCVSFIPSHFARRLSRGFELSALFAHEVAAFKKIRVLSLLKSTRNDPPLSSADSPIHRVNLVKGRFKSLQTTLMPMHILLVDDIVTTGATIKEASAILNGLGHEVDRFVFSKGQPN